MHELTIAALLLAGWYTHYAYEQVVQRNKVGIKLFGKDGWNHHKDLIGKMRVDYAEDFDEFITIMMK